MKERERERERVSANWFTSTKLNQHIDAESYKKESKFISITTMALGAGENV